ncbi:MAG: DUF2188 domain-containing protein [Ignavibacteria bacterium]|nr:DUF2188 domain-containing protein [Ignavibacteria bacterium]
MKKFRDQYVSKVKDGWIVQGKLNVKITSKANTKHEAIRIAVKIAKNQKTKVYVQNSKGEFINYRFRIGKTGNNRMVEPTGNFCRDPFTTRDSMELLRL